MTHHEEHEGKTFEAISCRVIGCAIEVHRLLGSGLLESSYQRCLSRELELQGIEHECECPLPIHYKGLSLDCVVNCRNFVPRFDASLTIPKALYSIIPTKPAKPLDEAQIGGSLVSGGRV